MKKIIFLLIIIGAGIGFSFIEKVQPHLLIPNAGMDDSLVFGKTTRAEIISRFGNAYTMQYEYIKADAPDTSHLLNRVIQRYPKLGIAFTYMGNDTSIVKGIAVNKMFPAKTDKGVTIGKWTMAEVELQYGMADWKFTDTSMFKEYSGIAFVIPFNKKFPVSEATMNAGEKKIISQIDIYYGYADINR
jgi:hypothetical protein